MNKFLHTWDNRFGTSRDGVLHMLIGWHAVCPIIFCQPPGAWIIHITVPLAIPESNALTVHHLAEGRGGWERALTLAQLLTYRGFQTLYHWFLGYVLELFFQVYRNPNPKLLIDSTSQYSLLLFIDSPS